MAGSIILENLRAACFQVISLLTTTGYSSADFGAWDLRSTGFLFVLMAIGGCTASTAGGLKIFRVTVALK